MILFFRLRLSSNMIKVFTDINPLSTLSYYEYWLDFEAVPDFAIRSFDFAMNRGRFFSYFS